MNKFDEKEEYVPYFIRMRGCINCEASELMRERHNRDYGLDHEILAFCVLSGCTILSPIFEECGGYSIVTPFFDPEEVMKRARDSGNLSYVENAKTYCRQIQKSFGLFYKRIGLDLSELIQNP